MAWSQNSFQIPFIQLADHAYSPVGGMAFSGTSGSPLLGLSVNVSGGIAFSGALTPSIGGGLTNYNFTVGGTLALSGAVVPQFTFVFIPLGGLHSGGSNDFTADFTPFLGGGGYHIGSTALANQFNRFLEDVAGQLTFIGTANIGFNPFANTTLTADPIRVFTALKADAIVIRPT